MPWTPSVCLSPAYPFHIMTTWNLEFIILIHVSVSRYLVKDSASCFLVVTHYVHGIRFCAALYKMGPIFKN